MDRVKLQRKLQDILGIDLSYLLKNGSIVMFSHTIGTLCGFGITLLLANFVDGTTYGQYKYVVAVAGILGAFSLTGAPSAILQSVAKGFEGAYAREKQLTIRYGIIPLLFAAIGGIYYLLKDQLILGIGLILVSVMSYLQSIVSLHVAFLNGKRDFKLLAQNQMIAGVVNFLGILIAIVLHFTSVLWIILAYNGSQLLFQMYAHRKTHALYLMNTELDQKESNLSRHLSLSNITTVVAEYIDKILIFQFLGPYQLALYAFSVGIPDQIRSLNKLVNTIVVPKLSVKNESDLKESVTKHTKTYFFITCIITFVFWFAATPLYHFLFPQYVEAAKYASLYMCILPIVASGMLYGHALQIENRIGSLYSTKLIDAVLKIALFIILIPHLGVLGAILGILVAKAVTMLVQFVLYKRHRPLVT
jgi:O-antigen/teichoic acid export membrane protein